MPASCCVKRCRARSDKESSIPLHRFPRNDHYRNIWRDILQIGTINLSAARVCGKHFSFSQYDNFDTKTLKVNAFPDVLFPRIRYSMPSNPHKKRVVGKRLHPDYVYDNVLTHVRNSTSYQLKDTENIEVETTQHFNNVPRNMITIRTYYQQAKKKPSIGTPNPDQSGTRVSPGESDGVKLYFKASMFEDIGREETVADSEVGEEESVRESGVLNDTSCRSNRIILFKGLFSIDGLTEKHLKYLSGLTKSQFEFVYELCIDRQTEWPHYGLTLKEQLLLTFIKLRKAWEFMALSIMFKVKESTVRDIFVFWINLLHNRLETIDFWKLGSREAHEYIAILDCTEIHMEKPIAPDLQQITFSKYKNTNTFKVLVAIDEQGTILFVSDAYGGSVSDNKIVELSGIISYFNQGDHILADRGFEQTDVLSAKGVILNRPPNKKGDQLSEEDVFTSRAIASRRIDVERVIGYAKTYKVLSHKVTQAMFPYMDKIIKVLFKLTNFRPPICKISKDRFRND